MQNKNYILDELREISPSLIPLQGKRSVYTVSNDYFNFLSDEIIEKLDLDETVSSDFTTTNPYVFPGDYFTTLSDIIMTRIALEESQGPVFTELEQIAPLLNTIDKKAVFTLPENYFEKASARSKTIPNKKSPVSGLVVRSNFFRYVVAAFVIGILVLGALQLKLRNRQESNTVEAVQKLSEQDIINFLKTTSPTDNVVTNNSTNNANTPDNNIKSSVRSMTDKEIQQFLKENGEQVEM